MLLFIKECEFLSPWKIQLFNDLRENGQIAAQ